jgi:DNA polymerase V
MYRYSEEQPVFPAAGRKEDGYAGGGHRASRRRLFLRVGGARPQHILRQKPVGVLGNQGACVIAKSYELKAKGVATGEPIWEALRKCPDSIYVKRDFRWYEVLSRKILGIMQEFSPSVEYYSIDEVFFLAEPSTGLSLQQTAEVIRARILELVGVPATVGIARSRTLAKLISDTAKPFGAMAVLDPDAERQLLATHPVTDICGIAGRRAARLQPYGINTCLDLAMADRRMVRSLLTIAGEAIWWELHGQPVQHLRANRPLHKMLSRGGSLGESTADPLRIHAWLVYRYDASSYDICDVRGRFAFRVSPCVQELPLPPVKCRSKPPSDST